MVTRDEMAARVQRQMDGVILGLLQQAGAGRSMPPRWDDDLPSRAKPVVGVVVQGGDAEAWAQERAQGTVESLTEWDWTDVPPDAQEALVAWWMAFRTWTWSQA